MKLNDVLGKTHELVKPIDIEGSIFDIIGAEGPVEGRYGPFIRFLVKKADGKEYALLLSHTEGQRVALLRHFTGGSGQTINGVTLEKVTLENGKSYWAFKDASDFWQLKLRSPED